MAFNSSADASGHTRHHNNPFGIKALKEDAHPSTANASSSHHNGSDKEGGDDDSRGKRSKRSRLKARSMSPFRLRYSRSSSKKKDDDADDSNGAESDAESVASSTGSGITPRNNAFNVEFDDDGAGPSSRRTSTDAVGSSHVIDARDEAQRLHHDTDDDEHDDRGEHEDDDTDDDEGDDDDEDDVDPELLDNTLFNAGCLDLHEDWVQGGAGSTPGGGHSHHHDTYIDENLEHDDDEHITAPNVVLAEQQVGPHIQRRGSKIMALDISRPLFERNRCTITLVHGDYDTAAKESKRPKRYIVASDGSEESSYAIEWTIGTVLRDGDETLVVSVMETDTKLDALDPAHEPHAARMEHQRTRQGMASVLARQATHLLERTRLEVRISCQAIHAKNSRHMLLDLIDFYAPTMVIVGSRGLGSLRGILLGSTSHYLVQKSSAPVMVARKRLKLPALPRGKGDVVQSVRMRHMRLDQAAVEKKSNVSEEGAKKDKSEGGNAKAGAAEHDDEDEGDGEAKSESDVAEAADEDAPSLAPPDPTTARNAAAQPTADGPLVVLGSSGAPSLSRTPAEQTSAASAATAQLTTSAGDGVNSLPSVATAVGSDSNPTQPAPSEPVQRQRLEALSLDDAEAASAQAQDAKQEDGSDQEAAAASAGAAEGQEGEPEERGRKATRDIVL
ncbi:uncharacterized protein PFL1_04842 [Pseudozyma flocculosa PF-1]|nr:uncharacterized protein PFL1_04842 [Pseudozyma flocculosa PF-1]EPQ27704.1 hypothetical protein PFL1_04842 [Pseudozyma flocculosa PF-1]